MKCFIQRVKKANVKVDNECVGEIGYGLLVFLGVGQEDTKEEVDYFVRKIIQLRIFADENEKMNLSIKEIGGDILLISQFTLYADCTHGNRPAFTKAGNPQKAKALYEYMIEKLKQEVVNVETGIFGAKMQVELTNDGPVTIMLEKEEK